MKRHVVGLPAQQAGDGRKRPLGPVRTQIQQCAVCRGAGQLARSHEFWEYSVRSPYDRGELPPPPTSVIKMQARQLWEQYQGRCPGCGGHGKLIVTYAVADNGTVTPLGVLHYDDRGLPPEELRYLARMNPTA